MKPSQGAILAEHLKSEPHTYMEMLSYGISVAPWKRIEEWLRINPEWERVIGKRYLGGGKYLTTWAVRRIRKQPALWRPGA